jgi:hypothetical protein
MQPATPAALQLASRLRQLRQQSPRLTQEKLARAFSDEESLSPATVSSWESFKSPKVPPVHRILAYARFFASPRSVQEKAKLFSLSELNQDEEQKYENLAAELLRLRNAVTGESPQEELTFSRSWHFQDGGRVTLVCAPLPDNIIGPFGELENPNYTELQTYADADALIELFGHIRAENPSASVDFKTPRDVRPDELTGHLVLLGAVAWNEITGRLSEMAKLPVRQVDRGLDSGEIFVAEVEGQERQFWPHWMDGEKTVLTEDVGLLVRVPNPLNAGRTLTICNGIHSRGVYGAVRSLTDAELRDGNERYISAQFGNARSFAIVMSVKVIRNKAMTPDFNSPNVILYKWAQDSG